MNRQLLSEWNQCSLGNVKRIEGVLGNTRLGQKLAKKIQPPYPCHTGGCWKWEKYQRSNMLLNVPAAALGRGPQGQQNICGGRWRWWAMPELARRGVWRGGA